MDQNGLVMSSGDLARARRRLTLAVLALLSTTVVSSVGLILIEGWSALDALFFTLITLTTVGYGDQGLSESGRQFTTILLVVGIGVASYTFALIVQSAISAPFAWRRRMQKRIDHIRDHTIVCGFGRMGRAVAERLVQEGEPLVVVERAVDCLEQAREEGYPVVNGCASEDEVMAAAGIERARNLISALDSEVQNIVVTLTARELNPDLFIVARAERDEEIRKLRRAGASRTVSPFQTGGNEIANLVLRPELADLLTKTSDGSSTLTLGEIAIEDGSPLDGQRLSDYGRRDGVRVAFVALRRPDEDPRISPPGSEVLRPKDVLIVAGDPHEVATMQLHASCTSGESTA